MKPLLIAALLGFSSLTQAAAPLVEVWKTPTCGCCKDWVQHLEDNGFEVKAHDVPDTAPQRTALGMPAELGSCHSARVGGYGRVAVAAMSLAIGQGLLIGREEPNLAAGFDGHVGHGHARLHG